ncbi:MAG: long-chain-acyl-CoA synthetase [Hyphomicrobiales bacterium]
MSSKEGDGAGAPAQGSQTALKGWLRALELTSKLADQPQRTLPLVINEQASLFGEAPALVSDRESFSFRGLAERANRYARWALAHGLGAGETVCLMMPNRPEYMAIWLGITQVGGVVALLNTNLRGASLAHCVSIVEPKHIIVAAELADGFEGAVPYLKAHPRPWLHGESGAPGAPGPERARIDLEIEGYSPEPLADLERRPVTLCDRALCIYTSGTTGLPKAANVSHDRVMRWSYWFAGMMGTLASDRMYDCLPMYHSIGGVVATGSLLVSGGSVAIAEKFSAERFWDDVVRFDCTLFQYIGELCRYLLKSQARDGETRHRLRLCCGNGLRLDVWNEFKDRFAIPQILEFYAATEGNFSLYNLEGKPGAIGRIPSFLAHRFPAAIVKFDSEAGEPARDAQGLCLRCARNEVGEAIGRISGDASKEAARFEGYTDRAESEKKILRDVFAEGDAWYRTGDLMRLDEKGFFYFVDRVGDTFRWKGENVATLEVAEAISSCPGVVEASVYGVAVEGSEGRAGMAALVIDRCFDPARLHAHLAELLPGYARPVFLRIKEGLEITETFKQKKTNLAREAFDPSLIADALYFDDPALRAYARLDADLYERIRAGKLRL